MNSTDQIEEVEGYTLNAWDCTLCGFRNLDDAEFSYEEVCGDCSERVRIV